MPLIQQDASAERPQSTVFGGHAGLLLAAFVIALVVAFAQWHSGAWRASYGTYPDEPSHFMGGLMVHDFLLSGSHSPLTFADKYYLYQPYFAIGYWPPVFYILEGLWMIVAGYSRPSVMVFSGLVTGLTALLLFRAMRRRAGDSLALAVTTLFLTIPSVQLSNSVVMTDMCVALFCFAFTLAAGKFLETREWRWAILTGVAASLAILTKYLSAFVFLPAALLILIDRRWSILRNARTWAAAGIVALVCTPWILWSRKFMLIAFDVRKEGLSPRLIEAAQAIHFDFGTTLTVAVLGATVWILIRWKCLDSTERLCALTLPCVVLLVALSPSDMERRYLSVAYPELLLTVALAVRWAGQRRKIFGWALTAGIVMLASSNLLESKPPLASDAARRVAHYLVTETNPAGILVPGGQEGPTIAEIASAESARSRILLIRPSKLLARMNWVGTRYESLAPDAQSMAEIFGRYPIDVIVTAETSAGPILPHERALSAMVHSNPRWGLKCGFEDAGLVWKIYGRNSNSTTDVGALADFVRTRLRAVP